MAAAVLVEPMRHDVTDLPRPHAWWVQVHMVPGAPDYWIVRHSGEIWGYRIIEGVHVGSRFSDDELRQCGFELCVCDPAVNVVDRECPAHGSGT